MTATATRPRRRLYYGWWVLAVSVTGACLGAVSSQLFTGALLPDIEDGTGWSRSSITLAVTAGSMTAGFSSPIWGRLADRYGARWLTSAGALIVVLAMLLLGISSSVNIVLFYAGYILARSVTQNAISGVVPRTTIVNWFRRMRGRSLGMLSMATPLGGAALVPLGKLIADRWGWENVYFLFAGLMLVVVAPLALLVLRRRPEDMGLLPDGDEAPEEGEAAKAAPAEGYDFTLAQAMRTRSFWLLVFAMACATCGNGGIGFHQAAYFEDQGVAAAAVALAISTYALAGAFANGLWGFLVERISERLLGAFTLFCAGLLPFYLLTVDSSFGALSFAVLFGLAARGESSIIVMIQAQYFGRGSFGAISGFSAPFQQIALGLGPTIAALIYDFSGNSYTIAFLLFSVLFMAAATMIFLSRQPPPPPEAATVLSAA